MRVIKNLNLDDGEETVISGPNGQKDVTINWKSILNFGDILKQQEPDI